MLSSTSAQAADTYWTNPGSGDWFDPLNWDNGVPTSDVNAYIDNGGTGQVATGGAATHYFYIGNTSAGAVEQTGGVLWVMHSLYMGQDASSEGTYTLSGGDVSASYIRVGYSGTGTVYHSGGRLISRRENDKGGQIIIGSQSNSSGFYYLSGSGAVQANWLSVGLYSSGEMHQSGGTCSIADTIEVGSYRSGSKGLYDLSGGTVSAGSIRVGYPGREGIGTFIQDGGNINSLWFEAHENSTYQFTGGNTTLAGGGLMRGVVDFGASGTPSLRVDSGILDLADADLRNLSRLSYTGGATSLLVCPAGVDPTKDFRAFSTTGFWLSSGQTLVIPAGRLIEGGGTIPGHVEVHGSLLKKRFGRGPANINIMGGLFVTDGGTVSLDGGSSEVIVENDISGLLSGTITCRRISIGDQGVGRFVQRGGSMTILIEGCLGNSAGSQGTYELHGGLLDTQKFLVGYQGEGHFIQTGGAVQHSNGSDIYCVGIAGGDGTSSLYELQAGTLRTHSTSLGSAGPGAPPACAPRFVQTGGEHSGHSLGLRGDSVYELRDGLLSKVLFEFWGGSFIQTGGTATFLNDIRFHDGTGTFLLEGGTLTVDEDIRYDGAGTFILDGGTLNLGGRIIRGSGTSQFIIAGGILNILGGQTFTADALRLGDNEGESSTFELQKGVLQTADATIGNYGSGTFELTGGTHIVQNTTHVGVWSKSYGCYRITVGALTTSRFLVGEEGVGVLEFLGSSSQVTVTHSITFGKWGGCISIPGAAIHMTGSAFENQSTDPAAMAGLGNLELIFEGGATAVDPFEVASAVDGGFDLNFALGTLTVGGADVGCVQLVDNFDNGNRGTFGAECLFAHTVNLQSGSTLDLSGLRLYVEGDVESMLDGCVADGRLLDSTGAFLNASYRPGKDWTVVPEPATLGLLVLGAAALIRLRRRPANR